MSDPRPRQLDPLEKALVLDIARGMTAEASGVRRHMTTYAVYEWHKKIKPLLGARNAAHMAALAVAYGYITPEEILEGTDHDQLEQQ